MIFTERDLFNANSLDEIKWLQVGDNILSKSDFQKYLFQNKSSIEKMLINPERADKIRDWFNLSEFEDLISEKHVKDFVNDNFNSLFI